MTEYLKINDTSDKTYVVLGSHRSGTTFITKALYDQGIKMGGGASGHREDIDFIHLNMDILKEAGGEWKKPPSEEAIDAIISKYGDRFKTIVDKKKDKLWGWKDPRQPLTMKGLVDYLEDDVYLVCVFRKPERVARSLFITNGMKNTEKLTREYSRRIIKVIERFMGL